MNQVMLKLQAMVNILELTNQVMLKLQVMLNILERLLQTHKVLEKCLLNMKEVMIPTNVQVMTNQVTLANEGHLKGVTPKGRDKVKVIVKLLRMRVLTKQSSTRLDLHKHQVILKIQVRVRNQVHLSRPGHLKAHRSTERLCQPLKDYKN
uniref:Uncharacterized protein n=1 Tax=Cacopsylla melanoneura TaxID=428564 RepID=A0A8D8RL22_9HEMI